LLRDFFLLRHDQVNWLESNIADRYGRFKIAAITTSLFKHIWRSLTFRFTESKDRKAQNHEDFWCFMCFFCFVMQCFFVTKSGARTKAAQ
jgi:hypothetical protein